MAGTGYNTGGRYVDYFLLIKYLAMGYSVKLSLWPSKKFTAGKQLPGDKEISFRYPAEKPEITEGYALESITIDGQELEKLITRFKNIPFCYGKCTWKGDMAEFIFENL